jgi:2-desacetyl-2-hydroxyethyl bacteriochlorophyllide A dehydrogenase
MEGSTHMAMRQIVLESPREVIVRSVPRPDPRPGDALVRTEQVGVCGSDLHAWHGKHPFITLPVVPGHEVVGTVEALGESTSGLTIGDWVVLEPNIVCGQCINCRSGRYNLCENLTVVGCVGPLDGGMAEYFIAPAERFIPVDSRLDLAQATMIEPLATGTHAVRVAGGTAGKRVAVLGAGPIGLLTMQAAKAGGAAAIVVTDLSEAKRSLAVELGADAAFDPRAADVVEAMRTKLGGPAEIVFDCVAIQTTISQAIALAHKGGTVVVEGVPEADVTIPLAIVQDREIRLQGTAMYTREDMLRAMSLIADGQVEVGRLVTTTLPLEQAAEAFALADSGSEIKVHLTI